MWNNITTGWSCTGLWFFFFFCGIMLSSDILKSEIRCIGFADGVFEQDNMHCLNACWVNIKCSSKKNITLVTRQQRDISARRLCQTVDEGKKKARQMLYVTDVGALIENMRKIQMKILKLR